jgi:hypothetical protein
MIECEGIGNEVKGWIRRGDGCGGENMAKGKGMVMIMVL